MGTYSLICHPDTPALKVRAVRVAWDGARLSWSVEGADALVVPPPMAQPARTDGLWKATCFELFLAGDAGYREINLSPSGNWAAYAFDGYRSGMREAPLAAPRIAVTRGAVTQGADFTLTATLPRDLISGAPHASLTAVIEEQGGHKSYWALAHAPGRPDFHSASCFILPLGAAQGA